MSFADHEGAAAATRTIERKMAEAVGVTSSKDVPDPTLAAIIEDLRAQLKTTNDKMEAGFKLAAQRIDSIEGRLDKIETFLHIPAALAQSLKNGH